MTSPSAADDGKTASELASASQQQKAGNPSAIAFTAMTQLLEACVANLDMPQLQDIVQVCLPPKIPDSKMVRTMTSKHLR